MSGFLRCAALLALTVPAPATPGQEAGQATRPNIVLVISDDQDYEHFGFMGHPLAHTPTLDELAKNGVLFPVAYATPRCRPTLAELLSGRWPHLTGIYYNDGPRSLAPEGPLPLLLREAGYATYCGGKFWEQDHHALGFEAPEQVDESFGRQGQEDLFRFLDARHDAPFFVWWAPSIPHTPHNPPREFSALFQGKEVPVPKWAAENPRPFVKAERLSLAMGAWFDDELGQLVTKLTELGELEQTLFVFLVDNGWANGLVSKGSPFEKGVRTPLVITWPGKIQPRRLEFLVDAIDLYPTILDYAGVSIPPQTSGRSLRPWLEGGSLPGRTLLCGAAYAATTEDGELTQDLYALYVRSAEWKYILYLREASTEPPFKVTALQTDFHCRAGEEALYSLTRDPYELENLAGQEEQRARVQSLRSEVLAWWKETGGVPLEVPEASAR